MADTNFELELEKAKHELTLNLALLTQSVSQFVTSTKERFDSIEKRDDFQDLKIIEIEKSLPAKKVVSGGVASSLPTSIKWLLIAILGIAFLGILGAAIGINLLQYLDLSKGAT